MTRHCPAAYAARLANPLTPDSGKAGKPAELEQTWGIFVSRSDFLLEEMHFDCAQPIAAAIRCSVDFGVVIRWSVGYLLIANGMVHQLTILPLETMTGVMDMRTFGLTCSALFMIVLPLPAQTPPPPPPAQPAPGRLDQLLNDWEVRMRNIDTFSTRVTRTETHPLTKRATTYVGEAAFMKPNMARIDLTPQDELGKKDSDKTNFERLICNGKNLFEYVPKEKAIFMHELPKGDKSVDENVILSFLKGMTAVAAKQRFSVILQKETEWYSYLMILPKTDADRQEFKAAQLTIWAKNPNRQGQPDISLLPCRFWYKAPNDKEMTYLFEDMRPNVNLARDIFAPTRIQGWPEDQLKLAAKPSGAPPTPTPKPIVREQTP
jgi:TIGR03009 family protein